MIRRIVQCISFGSLLALGVGAAEADSQWIRGVYTGESPRPVRLPENEAWQEASNQADHTSGAFVLVGSGQSMQPLYTPGTIMVLRKIPYKELKRGQTVLYLSKERKVVAHVLVAKARDGWRVQGLNNRIHDMEPVQSENLVGIVVAAYKPVNRPRVVSLAALQSMGPSKLN